MNGQHHLTIQAWGYQYRKSTGRPGKRWSEKILRPEQVCSDHEQTCEASWTIEYPTDVTSLH